MTFSVACVYDWQMGRRIDRVMQSFSQQQPRDMVRDTLAQLTQSTSSSNQAVVLQKIIEVSWMLIPFPNLSSQPVPTLYLNHA